MITKGLRAVIIVSAEDILFEVHAALRQRLYQVDRPTLDKYTHAIFIRAVESAGIGQVSRECRIKHMVNDRHVDLVTSIAREIEGLVWRLFNRFHFGEWLWIDDLKIVGGRELWLCWTH